MTGKLDNYAIEDLLSKHFMGRIGCHTKHLTYVVPISYAYDGEAVYCHSDAAPNISVMRKNPNVCFEVDTMHDPANWKTVIAWGRFEEIKEPVQRAKALQILFARQLPTVVSDSVKLGEDWPFQPGNLNEIEGIVFRIKLKNKAGKFETPD